MLDLLSLHKEDLLTLLRPANDGWSAEYGRSSSRSGPASPSSMAGWSRAAAESAGLRLLRSRMARPYPHTSPHPNGARPIAAAGNDFAIRCCPLKNEAPAVMFGCIALLADMVWARDAEAIAALSSIGIRARDTSKSENTRERMIL